MGIVGSTEANIVVRCLMCQSHWPVKGSMGEWEQQELERSACSRCGAHALQCVRKDSSLRKARNRLSLFSKLTPVFRG